MKNIIPNSKTTLPLAGFAVCVALLAGCAKVPKDGGNAQTKIYEDMRGLRFCEIFLIGGNGITGNLEAAVYSTMGNNIEVSGSRLNTAPQQLVDKLDLAAIKKEYGVFTAYLNEPRSYVIDRLEVPTGAPRDFNGLKMNWVASSHMKKPKGDMKDKSWLRYKVTPVERSTIITYKAGKPVFLLDDPDGKVWVMKAFRNSYDQTYESLSTLGQRYKMLPSGYKTRVAVLDKDLVLKPTGSLAHIMQDEFENTYDYLGDGSGNFVP